MSVLAPRSWASPSGALTLPRTLVGTVPCVAPALLATARLTPDPGQARGWVRRELSRPEYQQSLLERFQGWLGDLWQGLQATALGASPLSAAAAAVVLLVVVALVLLLATRVRREPASPLGDTAVLGPETVSADEHRRSAERALARGAIDVATVEGFRAVAARAVQRGVVEERPGLTAHELAADLAPSYPAHADGLTEASVLFDEVFYGDQPATVDDARSVLDLEDALRVARPVRGDHPEHTPAAAAPR